jgi:hypothetical protein
MQFIKNLLLNALRNPLSTESYTLNQWDMCVRMARNAGILARLYFLLDEEDVLKTLPTKVYEHLHSASLIAAQNERIVRWELIEIERILDYARVQTILLKGAAYVMAGLPPARGRVYSDIDILVPYSRLNEVETALMEHGWEHMKVNSYDQRYFRKWMHELPPLRHKERKTLLDVHHTILPRTGRLHPDPKKLLNSAVRIVESDLWTLSPADMILHSAAHLFQNGDLAGGLRDLTDLDDLLRYFGARQESFWADLVARGKEMDLERPLFYALRYTGMILGTPIPESAIEESESAAPPQPVLKFMDILVYRSITSLEPIAKTRGAAIALWCLYVRSHYLRMPPILLFFHLLRKSVRRSL